MSDEPLTGIVIYEAPDGSARLDVSFDGDTVWLTQAQMADLFDVSTSTISRHLAHIFEEGELKETSVTSNLQNVQINSGRKAIRPTTFYNLDAIISVGYRISSGRAIAFRQWATGVLKEYLRKGFALDDERLKNGGGGPNWEELLNRIRDIRSSEKVFYRQVLDLYATAIDYDPTSQDSIRFFKIVQNKLHTPLMDTPRRK